jgi:methylated-DNA-protein-cysteine methyltransferase-like protein
VFDRVRAIVRQIPRGKVATYGQIALIAGTTPRTVGFAMAGLRPTDRVPWQRVVNARGETSLRGAAGAEQRALLSSEGVRFDRAGRVDFARSGWLPNDPKNPRVLRRARS